MRFDESVASSGTENGAPHTLIRNLNLPNLYDSWQVKLYLGANFEEELEVEFSFEEVGAALGVAEIFGDVTASFDLKSDGTALEGGV